MEDVWTVTQVKQGIPCPACNARQTADASKCPPLHPPHGIKGLGRKLEMGAAS